MDRKPKTRATKAKGGCLVGAKQRKPKGGCKIGNKGVGKEEVKPKTRKPKLVPVRPAPAVPKKKAAPKKQKFNVRTLAQKEKMKSVAKVAAKKGKRIMKGKTGGLKPAAAGVAKSKAEKKARIIKKVREVGREQIAKKNKKKADYTAPPPPPPPPKPKAEASGGGTLMKIILKQDPIRWACFGGSAIYIYLKILAKHKNDCIFGFGSADATTAAGAMTLPTPLHSISFNTAGGGTRDWAFGLNLRMSRKPEVQDRLLTQYRKCKKNGKILCVPYFKASHANMIIFNIHTNTIEYYEPHGEGTKPFENAVKSIAKYFTRNGEKMGVSLSADTCPNFVEGWRKRLMGLQSLEHGKRQRTIPEQKAETGGFCCMWSFLHMDYRLSHPTKPPNAMANELVQLAKKNPEDFERKYIRGYTHDLLKEMYDHMGEDTIRSIMGRKDAARTRARTGVKLKLDSFIEKLWVKAGGKL